jgi:hypothetical protein
VSLPERVSSALHVEAPPASGFHRFALMQINRQSLIGRNVLMRNVRLFRGEGDAAAGWIAAIIIIGRIEGWLAEQFMKGTPSNKTVRRIL